MMPRPPASVTAFASVPPDAVPIGARRTGWLMPSFSVSFVRSGGCATPDVAFPVEEPFHTRTLHARREHVDPTRPIAVKHWHRSETPLRARTGHMHRSISPGTKKFFCKNVFHTKATPFMGQNQFWTGFWERGHD